MTEVSVRQKRSFPTMQHRAAELRKEMTNAEKQLWAALRGNQLHGVGFRRSHAIGPYVADFCSPKQKLIIELDGAPHLTQQEEDASRTAHLERLGYRVLRFWNAQVMDDLNGVLRQIEAALK